MVRVTGTRNGGAMDTVAECHPYAMGSLSLLRLQLSCFNFQRSLQEDWCVWREVDLPARQQHGHLHVLRLRPLVHWARDWGLWWMALC